MNFVSQHGSEEPFSILKLHQGLLLPSLPAAGSLCMVEVYRALYQHKTVPLVSRPKHIVRRRRHCCCSSFWYTNRNCVWKPKAKKGDRKVLAKVSMVVHACNPSYLGGRSRRSAV
jgi:hypothetical protein